MSAAKERQEIAERQRSLAHWIDEGSVELTLTGLTITDPDFDYGDYEELGGLLSGFHRSSCWWIGDWINFGEGTYGEKYAQAMEVTKLAEGTLMNYASVCRRIPRSRRKIELPFSVHVEVAPLSPSEQKHWLTVAARDDLRQRDLRQVLRPIKNGEATSEQVEKRLAKNGPPTIDDIRSLARSIVKQAVGDGKGRYLIPGELMVRLAATLGEGGFE